VVAGPPVVGFGDAVEQNRRVRGGGQV
jgi:hypothetical protein